MPVIQSGLTHTFKFKRLYHLFGAINSGSSATYMSILIDNNNNNTYNVNIN